METNYSGRTVQLVKGTIVSSTRGTWNEVVKPYRVKVTSQEAGTVFFSVIGGYISFCSVESIKV